MLNLNWKIIGWIVAVAVVLLAGVAVILGVEEALKAAGVVGAAAGAAALANRTDKARRGLDASDQRIRDLQSVPKKAEEDALSRVESMDDAEKVRRGNDLLGGGQ